MAIDNSNKKTNKKNMALIYLMHQILEPPLTPPWKGENSDFLPWKGGLRGVKPAWCVKYVNAKNMASTLLSHCMLLAERNRSLLNLSGITIYRTDAEPITRINLRRKLILVIG